MKLKRLDGDQNIFHIILVFNYFQQLKQDTRRRDPRRRPKFSTKLSDRQTVKGTRVRLTCNVICSPEDDVPEIEWFKSGYPMKPDERVKVIIIFF